MVLPVDKICPVCLGARLVINRKGEVDICETCRQEARLVDAVRDLGPLGRVVPTADEAAEEDLPPRQIPLSEHSYGAAINALKIGKDTPAQSGPPKSFHVLCRPKGYDNPEETGQREDE